MKICFLHSQCLSTSSRGRKAKPESTAPSRSCGGLEFIQAGNKGVKGAGLSGFGVLLRLLVPSGPRMS